MHPSEFVVGEDGFLRDRKGAEEAAWFLERTPALNALAVEAQIALMRACSATEIDAPYERRRGLSKARFTLLRMLAGATDGRLPMTEVVNILNVSPTNVTKLVDGLQRDQYVRRAGDVGDKRKLWIEILPAGREAVEETYPDVVSHLIKTWAGFKQEELRVLIHLLVKLRLDLSVQAVDVFELSGAHRERVQVQV